MKKIKNLAIKYINKVLEFLEEEEEDSGSTNYYFQKLTPEVIGSNEQDEIEKEIFLTYKQALDFSLANDDLLNIAISGPMVLEKVRP